MDISVIIPTFNRPAQTIRAVKSVQEQTHKSWELIIIDDGSSDNTYERLQLYLKDFNNIKYKLIKKTNFGVSHTRNLGAQLAKYDWISFLDSDDEWLPSKLNDQINFVKEKKCSWVYTNENWYKDKQLVAKPKSCTKYSGNVFSKAVQRCFIGASTVLINKNLFFNHGGFNEQMPVCEDYDLWLKILSSEPIGYIETPLINKFAGHDGQLSYKFKDMNYWRILSLSSLLDSYFLSSEQIDSAFNFITKNSPSLIKGLYKYQNDIKAQRIEKIMENIHQQTL